MPWSLPNTYWFAVSHCEDAMCKLAACHRYEALAFWSGGMLPCQITQQPNTHQHGHTQPRHLTACCQLGTFYFIGGCLGSGGRAVVWSLNPAVRALKCPWVSYWTPNCSQRHRHHAFTNGYCYEWADGKTVNHQNVMNVTPVTTTQSKRAALAARVSLNRRIVEQLAYMTGKNLVTHVYLVFFLFPLWCCSP